jgi:hypothetical protein
MEDDGTLAVEPLEALDNTSIIDIKIALTVFMHFDSHSSLPHVLTTDFIFPIPISAALVSG